MQLLAQSVFALTSLVLQGAELGQDAELGQEATNRAPPPPQLPDLERWRAWVRPSETELAYAALPWFPDFASGLRAAAEQRKPLLLWTMNGHPLGCT